MTYVSDADRAAAELELRRRAAESAEPVEEVPLWTPLPGPQTMAYYSEADELFYGGRAGGGKSDLLLGLAGTSHWRTVIFRRVFPNLRALIERSREIYNPTGNERSENSYNESLHLWRLGSGRMIELGAMQHDKDKFNWRGRDHDLKEFDELPEFLESQYLFALGWLRSTRPGQRVRAVSTGNPPTDEEGAWVIVRWAPWLDPHYPYPAEPGELRWFTQIDDKDTEVENEKPFEWKGETIYPQSRTFIPASLEDNPYLSSNTKYKSRLQSQPEPLRSQLLYGDFTLKLSDNAWQTIPTTWVIAAQKRWVDGERPEGLMRSLGVDVARGGRDRNAFAALYGTWFDEIRTVPGVDTPNGDLVAEKVIELLDAMDTPIGIDVIGVGTSPYDTLRRGKYQVVGINNSAGTKERDKTGRYGYANVRAASYWQFREALDPASGENIALPPDRELLSDLCSVRYRVTGGKYIIESKEEIIKRIGRSPDKGDAVILAWYRATHSDVKIDFIGQPDEKPAPVRDYDSLYSFLGLGGDEEGSDE